MAKRLPAKRANRANPREDRNVLDFNTHGGYEPNQPRNARGRRTERRHQEDDNVFTFRTRNLDITPRNLAQENYLDTLQDESYSIVFAMGPAGTGKTMLATQVAIKGLMEGRFKKIVITRPAVSVDEQHGFLPGDLLAKMAPWVIPIMDVIKEAFPVAVVEKMVRDEIIEVAPLAYMRGRTLKNAFVIADEMQNATPEQMKMVLTRIGDNSRMIITGDLRQHDRGFAANGLKDFVARLRDNGSSNIAVCEFLTSDVERHPVIEEVLRIYGEE